MGIETRDAWHKTDWEAVGKDTTLIEMPRPQWIFGHDCQEYAYAEFDRAMDAVNTGTKYMAYNIPPEDINHRTVDFRTDHAITHKGLSTPILQLEDQIDVGLSVA